MIGWIAIAGGVIGIGITLIAAIGAVVRDSRRRGLLRLEVGKKPRLREEGGFHEGERRDVSVMFSQLLDLPSIAESIAPEDVADIIQAYRDYVSRRVVTWDGTVGPNDGDKIAAFWNAPRLQPDYPLLAVRCACDLIGRSAELFERLLARGLPPVQWSIGIDSGFAVIGLLGSYNRPRITAIGDAVITAERLGANSPAFHVLVGETTYQLCKDFIAVDLVPAIHIRANAAEKFPIYDVRAMRESPGSPWVPLPTEMAVAEYARYAARFVHLPGSGAASGSILVGEAAQEVLAREGRGPHS